MSSVLSSYFFSNKSVSILVSVIGSIIMVESCIMGGAGGAGGGGAGGAGGGPSPTAPGGGGRSGSTYQYGPLSSQPHTNPGFNGVSGTKYTGGGGGSAGYSSGSDAFTSGLIWGSGAPGIVIIRYIA